jgi:predicted secreted Zn-dependent protease
MRPSTLVSEAEHHRRPPRGGAALLLGLALAGAWPARAEVGEQLDERWYDVDARAHATLRQALDAASPIRREGKTYHGYTEWRIEWRYRWRQGADGLCRITSVRTHLEAQVTLPRLTGASAAQRETFARYLERLRAHEMGHVALAREAAREIDRGIAGLAPMRDCQSLDQRASTLGYERLRQARERERAYDRRTDHGRREGVQLPR